MTFVASEDVPTDVLAEGVVVAPILGGDTATETGAFLFGQTIKASVIVTTKAPSRKRVFLERLRMGINGRHRLLETTDTLPTLPLRFLLRIRHGDRFEQRMMFNVSRQIKEHPSYRGKSVD